MKNKTQARMMNKVIIELSKEAPTPFKLKITSVRLMTIKRIREISIPATHLIIFLSYKSIKSSQN